VLVIREFRRLKQVANEVATNPIQDLMENLLEEGGNDTVQPCDTTQARSYSNFSIKFSIVQFYAIEYNSKSNRRIYLKLHQKITKLFLYIGVTFQVNCSSKGTCDIGHNRL
jgi:hypothetical protein